MSKATGNEIPDLLVALDWHELTCQSKYGCTNQASHVVHLHALDECNHPHLDPFGNRVEILCLTCRWDVEAVTLQTVDRLRHCSGTFCLTCGAPMAELTDIIRDVVALS